MIKAGQLELRFFPDGGDTTIRWWLLNLIPPGAKVPVTHYHKDVDEMVYGLKGTVSSYIGEKGSTLNKVIIVLYRASSSITTTTKRQRSPRRFCAYARLYRTCLL